MSRKANQTELIKKTKNKAKNTFRNIGKNTARGIKLNNQT